MTDTKELRRLLAEATPGEWKTHSYSSTLGTLISYGDICKGENIAGVMAQSDPIEAKANAALIVALRNVASELLDDMERAKQLLSFAAEMDIPSSLQRSIADFLAPKETT